MDNDIIIKNFSPYIDSSKLQFITIYDNTTKDYTGFYVARLIEVIDGKINITNIIYKDKELKKVREAIPNWMLFLNRSINDDICILENYM